MADHDNVLPLVILFLMSHLALCFRLFEFTSLVWISDSLSRGACGRVLGPRFIMCKFLSPHS